MRTYFYSYCINKLHYFSIVVLTSFLFFAGYAVNAQTIKTVGATGDYTTLKAAFDAINAGSITGAIELQIIGNTIEDTSAVLNASGSGSANYTSLDIYPTVAGVIISKVTASLSNKSLIDLNGASNVTIDGRLNRTGSTIALTLMTKTIDYANNSVIRMLLDASNNTVKYCDLKGSRSAIGNGIFYIYSSTNLGCDNIAITNNKFSAAYDTTEDPNWEYIPQVSIYATSANSTIIDDLNISYNEFTSLYNKNGSTVIDLRAGTNNFIINNNSFYQAESFNFTLGRTHTIIYTLGLGTISNNFIGGTASNCGGTQQSFYSINSNTVFYGINTSNSNQQPCVIENNTISNIKYFSNNTTLQWNGIVANGVGPNIVQNNTIGSTTSTTSIEVLKTNFIGYSLGIGSSVTLQNNSIGGITLSEGDFAGFHLNAPLSTSIVNNVIGSTTVANSISGTSIVNMYGFSMGLNNVSASNHLISSNTIANIVNNTTSGEANTYGIYSNGFSQSVLEIKNNFIRSLFKNTSNTTGSVYGIKIDNGEVNCNNNVITLGGNGNYSIYGVWEGTISSRKNSLFFNTIYLSGTASSGALNSYTLYSDNASNESVFNNNVFVNSRSNSGATAKHYAAYFNYGDGTNLTLDNNLYYAPGTGGVIGYYNSLNVTSLPLVSGKDTSSYQINPSFSNANGVNATDFKLLNTSLQGVGISGIITDYLNQSRLLNTIGAFDTYNFVDGSESNIYIGTANGLWSLPSNWSLNHTPIADENIFITTNTVQLDQDYSLNSTYILKVYNNGGIIVNPNKTLTINGSADFGNRPVLFKSDATGYGQLGTVSGTITGATNVQSENYVAARRAYRLLTSPVTTTTSIRANWQENSNNTSLDYANNQNPNPGFGTHITGSATGLNGFDATATGNSSLYTFTNATQAWSAIANTNNTALTVGQPYRLMVRGDRSIDLSTNTPDPTPTVLRATGTLQIGNFSTTLSTTANHYNLVANPYQSPIYANTMFGSPSNYTNVNNQFFYVWDPQLGLRGAYTTITIASGAATGGSTHTNKINPWEAFFVKTGVDGASSIVFKEDYKNPPVIVMGRSSDTPDTNSSLTLNLKGLQVNGDYQYVDGIRMDFGVDYALEIDSFDAEKFINLDEDVAIQKQNQLLTVERRAIPTVTETVPLQVTKYRSTSYIFENQAVGLDGVQAFLKDNYTNILHELEGTPYAFTVNTAIPASFENNRFELVFQNSALNTSNFEYSIGLYPNPSQGATGFYLSNMTADTKVALFTLLGQSVPVATVLNGNTLQVHPKSSLCQGVYLVQVTSPEGLTKQVKWIVE